MHWFTGNIGYHHIHHLNAKIPFYRLPEAMAGIEEMQSPTTTSLHPLDIFRCLQLKLWDYENDRLVTFKEAAAVRREFVPKLVKPEDGADQQATTSPLSADVDVDDHPDTRLFG